jgi:hypothetical protein
MDFDLHLLAFSSYFLARVVGRRPISISAPPSKAKSTLDRGTVVIARKADFILILVERRPGWMVGVFRQAQTEDFHFSQSHSAAW